MSKILFVVCSIMTVWSYAFMLFALLLLVTGRYSGTGSTIIMVYRCLPCFDWTLSVVVASIRNLVEFDLEVEL